MNRNRLWPLAGLLWLMPSPASAIRPSIDILSSKPAFVSGGDALVRISDAAGLAVKLNGADISGLFALADGRASIARVAGLRKGTNLLTVQRARGGRALASLTLVDHPVSGPVLSGPQMTPFICSTADFKLPDGHMLGDPIDAACSIAPRSDYVYMATGASELKPLPSLKKIPADVATTTTIAGATVRFIVRVDTVTINRGIYQSAILLDPFSDRAPSATTPPKGWNRRLIAIHGFGCTGGWYVQGKVQGGNILDPVRLGEGYAIFTNTLRHPSNSCNAHLAGETTMMDKEHFIESYGVPDMTVSMGSSGGAYTSLQIADAFPGLFDGVLIGSTFPDALSIALAGMDARLIAHYAREAHDTGLSEAQIVAISGYKNMTAFRDAANQAQRTDPVAERRDLPGYGGAVWPSAVPQKLRYDPRDNRGGARPTVFDAARNIYGVDPATGFARRPFDNVGVQYGLAALAAGTISPAQFLALNEAIGGYDDDLNFIPARNAADPAVIRNVERTGLALVGNGGLAAIPVMDASAGGFLYDEDVMYHYQWFHFAVRERLKRANGDARNHVMWRGGVGIAEHLDKRTPEGMAMVATVSANSWGAFIDWVARTKADHGPRSAREKTIADRPANLVDGCWTADAQPRFIAEPQTWSSKPDSRCNAAFPSYGFARNVAGGPLSADVYKCALKPIDWRDYPALSEEERRRLLRIFPQGVCDYAKPGLGSTGVEAYPVVSAIR